VIKVVKRQVFDIPVSQTQVTEHQAKVKYCNCCNKMVTALFPQANLLPAIKKRRGRIANRPGHNLLIRLFNYRETENIWRLSLHRWR